MLGSQFVLGKTTLIERNSNNLNLKAKSKMQLYEPEK